jgi:hypothetical protein
MSTPRYDGRRVVSLATPENVSAIDHAIAKGLPIPGYVVAEDGESDVTNPAAVAQRKALRSKPGTPVRQEK